ncbi:hypothetical protein CH063_11635 [Colletotrichum higginsianum]|uniref:Uncharacterized protein n=1 Tax=Colletotrichum higginsianum (strain IMI 349063) TaxID=759273 RepID=H1VM67_COLHI|nr:hypothetical protein CH63R_14448 [Colletotrichum higginsianum IMI 349063]OBR02147.1 hypothetical protein CH63R_14448 [Colletotrichum higginsianum IMI 349063]CCF41320.1 hypothetical protein CH063_11635 [Colletotrichum higginsianum]
MAELFYTKRSTTGPDEFDGADSVKDHTNSLLKLITGSVILDREVDDKAGSNYYMPTILELPTETLVAIGLVTNWLSTLAADAPDGTFKLWLSDDVKASSYEAGVERIPSNRCILRPGKNNIPSDIRSYVEHSIDHSCSATTTTVILASVDSLRFSDTSKWLAPFRSYRQTRRMGY